MDDQDTIVRLDEQFKKRRYVLVFRDAYVSEPWVILRVDLDDFDRDKFIFEVDNYNAQIKALENGTASKFSYKNEEDRSCRVIGQHNRIYGYQVEFPSVRSYYEPFSYWMELIDLDRRMIYQGEWDEYDDFDKPEFMDHLNTSQIDIKRRIEFFEDKYDSYNEFSLGYGILPLTALYLNQQTC